MSRVTTKFQATVPTDVRAALGVTAGDTLVWAVRNGAVSVHRMPKDLMGWDPLAWLSFADDWLSPEDEEAFRDLQPL